MKQTIWFTAVFMITALTACNSDADESTGALNQIPEEEDELEGIEEQDTLEEEVGTEDEDRIEDEEEDETTLNGPETVEPSIHLEDVELISFEDLDDDYSTTISQDGGIDNVIYYGDNELLTSEFSKGSYLYDIDLGDTVWQDNHLSTAGYLQHRDGLLYTVNMEGQIAAVKMETGETERTYDYRNEEDGGLVPDNLFVLDDVLALTAKEKLIVYDLESTEQLWDVDYTSYSNIAETDDLIIYETFEAEFIAINKVTGEEQWKIDQPDSYSSGSDSQPFVVDDLLYIFSDDTFYTTLLEVYDVHTKEQVDSVVLEGYALGREEPFVAEDTIFFSSNVKFTDGDIVALEKDLEKERWRVGSEGYIKQQLVYDNGYLYVILKPEEAEISDPSQLIIIEEESGDIVERVEVGRFERAMTHHPEENVYVDNGKLYIHLKEGINDGRVRIYEPNGEVNRPFE